MRESSTQGKEAGQIQLQDCPRTLPSRSSLRARSSRWSRARRAACASDCSRREVNSPACMSACSGRGWGPNSLSDATHGAQTWSTWSDTQKVSGQ